MNTTNETTIQRDWFNLKSGDTIWFAGQWRDVFDAYCGGWGVTVIALIDQSGYPEEHAIRLSKSSATVICRIK